MSFLVVRYPDLWPRPVYGGWGMCLTMDDSCTGGEALARGTCRVICNCGTPLCQDLHVSTLSAFINIKLKCN